MLIDSATAIQGPGDAFLPFSHTYLKRNNANSVARVKCYRWPQWVNNCKDQSSRLGVSFPPLRVHPIGSGRRPSHTRPPSASGLSWYANTNYLAYIHFTAYHPSPVHLVLQSNYELSIGFFSVFKSPYWLVYREEKHFCSDLRCA